MARQLNIVGLLYEAIHQYDFGLYHIILLEIVHIYVGPNCYPSEMKWKFW